VPFWEDSRLAIPNWNRSRVTDRGLGDGAELLKNDEWSRSVSLRKKLAFEMTPSEPLPTGYDAKTAATAGSATLNRKLHAYSFESFHLGRSNFRVLQHDVFRHF
jgi:hypothetical protein